MLSIRTSAEAARALDSPLDPRLKRLLSLRLNQLTESGSLDLSEVAHLLVVEPNDFLSDLELEAGFPLIDNLVDGTLYGQRDYQPSFEWALDHGGLFEAIYILSDDGFGTALFVPDHEGVEPTLLRLLRTYATSVEPPAADSR